MKKTLKIFLQVAFSLLLGGFFIWFFIHRLSSEEITEIWNAFKRANYSWLILSLLISIISHWIRGVRSILLLETLGYKPKKLNSFFAVMFGYLANLAVPRLGEILRCSMLARYEKIPVNKSFGTIITERVIDMIIYILLFLLVLATFSTNLYAYAENTFLSPFLQKVSLLRLAGILASVALIFTILYFSILRKKLQRYAFVQKTEHFVIGIWQGLKSITKLKRPFTFTIETILIWLLYFAGLYICFLSLPETSKLPISAGWAAMAFSTIGSLLVQGGIGLYPLFIAGTLAVYGIGEPIGYAMGWLIWSAQQIGVIIVGALSIILLPYYNNRKNAKIRTCQNENS